MRFAVLRALLLMLPAAASAQGRAVDAVTRDLSAMAPVTGAAPAMPALEQPAGHSQPASTAAVIGAVRVEGAHDLPPEVFSAAIAPFLGKTADASELRALAAAVSSAARNRGYVFATATVPAQAIRAGVVTVALDGGRIDAVRILGSDSPLLKSVLERLTGARIDRRALERQLLLAGDIPGIEVVKTRYAIEGDKRVLIVDVRERRVTGYAAIDNYGSDDVGPERARLRYDFAGLALHGDTLTLQAVTTALDPRELAFGSVRYAMPLGGAGAQFYLSASGGRVRPRFSDGSGVVTTSLYLAGGGSVPLRRSLAASAWLNGEAAYQALDGRDGTRDRLFTLSAWLYATMRTAGGRLLGAVGLVQGLPLSEATREGDARSTRFDGTAVFSKAYAWADWLVPLGSAFSLRLAANGQISSDPLLASQQIGLGGISYGRAYDFYELYGDAGLMGSLELRWRRDLPGGSVGWLQPYAFVDGGKTWALRGDAGDGALASAGGGMRFGVGKTELGVEAAIPVTEKDGPGRRRVRANLSVGQRF